MTRRRQWALAGAVVLVAIAFVAAWHAKRTALRQGEIDALCAKLSDPGIAVRQAAADELAAVRDPAGIRRIAIHIGIVKQARTGIDGPEIGIEVAVILGRIGAPAAESLADVCRKVGASYRLDHFPWTTAWLKPWRAWWLGLPEGTDVEQWRAGAFGLVQQVFLKIGRPARPALIKMIADHDAMVRSFAVDTLVEINDPRDFSLFLTMTSDGDPHKMSGGLQGLWLLQMTLVRGFARNEEAGDDAAWQVCRARRDEALKAVLSCLKSEDTNVRQAAAQAVGEYYEDPIAAQTALKIAQDPSQQTNVRLAAANGLLDSTESRPALIRMLGDADALVRDSVARDLAGASYTAASVIATLNSTDAAARNRVVGYYIRIVSEDRETAAAVALLLDSTDAAMREGVASYFIHNYNPDNIYLIADAYGEFGPAGRQNAEALLRKISAGAFEVEMRRARLQEAAREALKKIGIDSSAPQ